MPVNPKAVRALNKVLDAGFTEERYQKYSLFYKK